MERPEPRVRLCQIERGGGKLVAEGDVRAVAPLMKVLDWLTVAGLESMSASRLARNLRARLIAQASPPARLRR